jgi:predicted PhzF superfamily epimerase YddE/YHI9
LTPVRLTGSAFAILRGVTLPAGFPVFVVDAFVAPGLAGNPAGVVLLDEPRDDAWRAAVAAELGYSETAFLEAAGAEAWNLRWFTPAVEVDLCGHATLASAHVLWESGLLAEGRAAHFATRSGELLAARLPDGRIELDLPVDPVRPVEPPVGLPAALGCPPVFVGSGTDNLLVELATAALVRGLVPDQAWLAANLSDGLIATARSDVPDAAIVSRYFCPAAGIAEDPVTGSAHCALAAPGPILSGAPGLTAWRPARRHASRRARRRRRPRDHAHRGDAAGLTAGVGPAAWRGPPLERRAQGRTRDPDAALAWTASVNAM